MGYAKVIDHPNLVRDLKTGAILNIDSGAPARHQKRLLSVRKEVARDQAINKLNEEVAEIKHLLQTLLKRIDN